MSENTANSEDLEEQFRLLGANLHKVIKSVWESPERKKIETELVSGLTNLTNSLVQSGEEFTQSETGQHIKMKLENLEHQIKVEELQENFIQVLRNLNRELDTALEKWNLNRDPEK
ncbi:MAG: hypothetical protein IT308_06180 [Anaerolineaceae bacterium]|nr:hypothetical protein [Anaerolineaceae bacterium]